jgi:hypothetical protein
MGGYTQVSSSWSVFHSLIIISIYKHISINVQIHVKKQHDFNTRTDIYSITHMEFYCGFIFETKKRRLTVSFAGTSVSRY